MKTKKPDNVVYSVETGFNANVLPYATNVGAPVISVGDVVSWKSRGIDNVNKELGNKFNELKLQYQKLMEEYEWNELMYGAKFSFEPVIGEVYHLYRDAQGVNFLSLIGPDEWNREHIGTFKLNSDKKWILLNSQNTDLY